MKNLEILIADDHSLILEGINLTLQENFAGCQVTSLMSGEEVCRTVDENRFFDLYILDLEFRDISGFDLITKIRSKYPLAKIIVCSMHEEVWYVRRLLEVDINGIVLKSSVTDCIAKAIRTVMNDEIYLCPQFVHLRNKNLEYIKRKGNTNLFPTTQERKVLSCMAKGSTSLEIAEELSISENTVETHRKNLFMKLDAKNAAHLIRIALEKGFLDL